MQPINDSDRTLFDSLSQSALFWMDATGHDDPHPTRSFAIAITDQGDCIEIQFQPFWVEFKQGWGGEAEPQLRLSSITRLHAANADQTLLFALSPGKQIYFGSGIPVDEALRPHLPSMAGKLVAIDPWDKSDLAAQQVMDAAAHHLKGLYETQEAKGYKPGWVYYRFNEYISQAVRGKYCFPQAVRGNTWSALMSEAESRIGGLQQ